ncbi:MAG: hypothetical protein FWE42_03220 [Defluviitaleaceae bacterium]|nr:hypothetical protein [Defluviitaleaceae bacterium]
MEWERAKTYILLFFVLLNLTLGGLLIIERRRYTLSPEREQAIVEIMYQNNITMDARVIRRFAPMRLMYVGGFYYDVDKLSDIFFGNAAVNRVATAHGYTITHGQGELTIAHGFISYNNSSGHGGRAQWMPDVDRAQAERVANDFVRANWPDFRLEDVFIGPDWVHLSYRQVYRGYVIHSNFIDFIITERGIVQVEMQFGQVLEIDRERQPIAAPDEALLSFIQRFRYPFQDTPMTVIRMDLVYFQDEGSPDPNGRYRLEPFYRVFIGGNERDPLLINAFTNELIN